MDNVVGKLIESIKRAYANLKKNGYDISKETIMLSHDSIWALVNAIEELEAAAPKWISVIDNPPSENDIVFVYDYIEGNIALVKVLEARLASIDVEEIFPKHGVQFVATHWMPLKFPEPPEENG